MSCESCKKESEILLPCKIVTSKKTIDEEFCPICFQVLVIEGKLYEELEVLSMVHAQYEEGNCNSCNSISKLLRRVFMNYQNRKEEELLLCPHCYKNLQLKRERGELTDFTFEGLD